MFKRIFNGDGAVHPKNFEEGRKLFEAGMQQAARFECDAALELYTRSIAVCPNPAPYINRANLLGKRLRHHEALTDLLEARRLDRAQGREFCRILAREIALAEAVTHCYRNGLRERLIDDLADNGEDHVVGKIFCACFGMEHIAWEYGRLHTPLADFHFFNELDNLRKFETLDRYPEAAEFLAKYPGEFIDEKLADCPDPAAYDLGEKKLHGFLCVYDEKTMIRLRRVMLYQLHERLLNEDYPARRGTLDDPHPGITRDAYVHFHGHDFSIEEEDEEEPAPEDNPFDGDLDSENGMAELVWNLTQQVQARAPTELDVYRYLVEEAERFAEGGAMEQAALRASGLTELEYAGERAKAANFAETRAALDYLNEDVTPALTQRVGPSRADEIRAYVFSHFVLRPEAELTMQSLRLKYAVHYCNNCLMNGHLMYHDRWAKVIEGIEARIDAAVYGTAGG